MDHTNKQAPFTGVSFSPPSFPDRTFDIRKWGAIPDGTTINTAAFNKAIVACSAAGGGTVLAPAGIWLTGAIKMQNYVNLRLEKDALVKFSAQPSDYLPAIFTRWEGVECYNYSALIHAEDCHDIAVTGEGIFEGQGEKWWPWQKKQAEAAQRLYDAEFKGLPVSERIFGTEQAALRPQFIQPLRCKNVLIEGVTFHNGPMWTIHPVYCEQVTIRNVKVLTEGPNTDGLNPDSCRNVLVEGCFFSTGDDCIAINSGMNEDGWRVGRPCENIEIRNCRMENGHGGVVIGSGMSGGVRNVYAHDCAFKGPWKGIRMKSMRGRGGLVENIRFENIAMENIPMEAIDINLVYEWTTVKPNSQKPPKFRNIGVSNVTCRGADTGVLVQGLPESSIDAVTLERLDMRGLKKGIVCQNVAGLNIIDASMGVSAASLV